MANKPSFLDINFTHAMQLPQRYFLKKMLFNDVISFDPYVFQNSRISSANINRN